MSRSASEIEAWCVNYLANLLKVPASKIDHQLDFDRHGLDSAIAVAMIMDLEDFLGVGLSPSLLFEHTCIAALARHLGAKSEPVTP